MQHNRNLSQFAYIWSVLARYLFRRTRTLARHFSMVI